MSYRVHMRFAVGTVVLLCAPCIAHAGGFFFFLPGSVTGAISDAVTGAEGNNCVSASAKVGDRITIPGVGVGTVKSLSGTSVRCTTAMYPIRALLDFNNAVPLVAPSATPPSSPPVIANFEKPPEQPHRPWNAGDSSPNDGEAGVTTRASIAPPDAAAKSIVVVEPSTGTAAKLRELSNLFNEGVITREEFDAKRKQLLERL